MICPKLVVYAFAVTTAVNTSWTLMRNATRDNSSRIQLGRNVQIVGCVEVCYFGVRKMEGDEFVIDRKNCYGCGLCMDVCPADCIRLVKRNE